MPHRPKKVKKADSNAPKENRADQLAAQRRMEFTTRSTLNRLRNRSSDRK